MHGSGNFFVDALCLLASLVILEVVRVEEAIFDVDLVGDDPAHPEGRVRSRAALHFNVSFTYTVLEALLLHINLRLAVVDLGYQRHFFFLYIVYLN